MATGGSSDGGEGRGCVLCGVALDASEGCGRLHVVPFEGGGALHLRECEACSVEQDPVAAAQWVRALVVGYDVVFPGTSVDRLVTAVPVPAGAGMRLPSMRSNRRRMDAARVTAICALRWGPGHE